MILKSLSFSEMCVRYIECIYKVTDLSKYMVYMIMEVIRFSI